MVKYPLRMARPRQWKKKFTNIHTELKAAYNQYQRRQNVRKNNMAITRFYRKNRPFVKDIGYGKYRLNPTRGFATGYGSKRRRISSFGGRKMWRFTYGKRRILAKPMFA